MLFQIGGEPVRGQRMFREIDPHVALGADHGIGNVVAQGIRVYHGRGLAAGCLALQPHIARDVDHFAARLDVRDIAHHDPGLSIRDLVDDADVVQRHLVAVRDLIDALGLDADVGVAGEIIVGEHGVLQVIARQVRLFGVVLGLRPACR